MLSSKLLSLSALTLLPLAFAAPAPVPEPLSAATSAIQWTPIDFNGKTIYVNTAAVSSVNPAAEATKLLRRVSDNCDGTTLDSHPAPFANTADCEVIRDYCATHDVQYGVWTRTPDTHGVLYYGTCVFEAGTRNIVDSLWIGSTNIADITRAALDRWQSGGVVAAQGQTECHGGGFGTATVRWTIKHS